MQLYCGIDLGKFILIRPACRSRCLFMNVICFTVTTKIPWCLRAARPSQGIDLVQFRHFYLRTR